MNFINILTTNNLTSLELGYYALWVVALLALFLSVINYMRISKSKKILEVNALNQKEDIDLIKSSVMRKPRYTRNNNYKNKNNRNQKTQTEQNESKNDNKKTEATKTNKPKSVNNNNNKKRTNTNNSKRKYTNRKNNLNNNEQKS